MSEQQSSLTYEGILELFRQTREQFQETREQFRETREQFREMREQFREMSAETDRQFRESREQFREMSAETDRQFRETREQMQETDRKMKETDRKISALGSRIGEIVENMVGGNIVDKFKALGYDVTAYSRNKVFGERGSAASGEIDLILEDGDIAILIEVKTTLKTADVQEHIERLEKHRRCINAKGSDKRRFVGAVAGAVVTEEVAKFAQKKGLYVIVQSGNAVEILPPPEGFTAKEW